MNESARKKIVYMTAAAVVAWAIYNLPGDGDKVVSESTAPAESTPVPTGIADEETFVDMGTYQELGWGRDPFRPWPPPPKSGRATTRQPTESRWSLGGILYNDGTPLAYINGRSVRIGDTVGGAKVVAINRKTVTLMYQSNLVTIPVSKG